MTFKRFFSEQARKPSGLFGRVVMSRIFDMGNAALNDFMKEILSLRENDRVLEIGFGTGKLLNEMAELAYQGLIEGIDFSSTMVAVAKRKNKKHILEGRVKIRQGDFEEMTYDDNCFDKVCSVNAIYFWPNPDRFINKILKIVKPSGKLVLGFEDRAQMEKRQLSTNVFRIISEDEVKDVLMKSGFATADIVSKKIHSSIYHCAVATK